jgi:hypothetical protein
MPIKFATLQLAILRLVTLQLGNLKLAIVIFRHLTIRHHYISSPITIRHRYISTPLNFVTITIRQYNVKKTLKNNKLTMPISAACQKMSIRNRLLSSWLNMLHDSCVVSQLYIYALMRGLSRCKVWISTVNYVSQAYFLFIHRYRSD